MAVNAHHLNLSVEVKLNPKILTSGFPSDRREV
jgi:hypothetical protein